MKKKTTTAVARAAAKKPQYLVHADPPAANMEAAARINHWHSITKQAGQMAIAAALHAGMELFQAKLAHPGTFEQWIEANCEFDRRTAYRYLQLVQQALGADDLPKLADSSAKKRDAAIEEFSAQTDAQTLTELYADFGIVRKAPSKMGGRREGAGRPKKNAAADEAAELDRIANNPALLYAAIKEPLATVYRVWREKDVFARIGDGELAQVAGTLAELSSAATAALKGRTGRKK